MDRPVPRTAPCAINCRGDGDQILALIGSNIQEGICGFGDTLPDALRNLAKELEAEVDYENPENLVMLEYLLTELRPAYTERRLLTFDECERIFAIMEAI